jgi:NAD(P)H dehydrogenase (quinone)
MKVLVVYAHQYPWSLNHAILESFTKGLAHGGHTFEVVDLYAMKFDPVITGIEFMACVQDDTPEWVLEAMKVKEQMLKGAGGPIRRFLLKRWMRGKSYSDIGAFVDKRIPKVVKEQQAKVAQSDAIAFISPVWWNNFPTILKGWVERVFSYGFAYALNESGWRGEVEGRIGLLKLKKALVINTLFFREEVYREVGLLDAMRITIDEWGLKYPGIPQVDHVYFSAVYGVDDETRKRYLEEAYSLGKGF